MLILFLSLACTDKDVAGSEDSTTPATTTTADTEAVTDDTSLPTDTSGTTGETGDTDDIGTTEPPRECVDYRDAYIGCTASWQWNNNGESGPRGVDTFDDSGDLVRSEIDNEGDGIVDTTIVQSYDSGGRVVEHQSWQGSDSDGAEPFTHITYTWQPDGRPDTYRYLRNNGSDVNNLYTYVYDEDGVLERFIVDARDDGDSERECNITWSSTYEGTSQSTWECFGQGTETTQEQIFDSTEQLRISRHDDFNNGVWNREVFNTYRDDCLIDERETLQDQEYYETDVHDRIERSFTYDDKGRWVGDETVNIESDGSRPDYTSTWTRTFDCP